MYRKKRSSLARRKRSFSNKGFESRGNWFSASIPPKAANAALRMITSNVTGIFAGKLNYPRYPFMDRQVIRLIMWMTNGPTHSDAVVDYTDWSKVEAFAAEIGNLPG